MTRTGCGPSGNGSRSPSPRRIRVTSSLTMGSLFAGIGGFDLAAEWAGHRTIWTSEIDPYCVALLAERFPEAKQLGDITSIDWSTVERPDIVAGGFPCQDISYAGKGAGLAGERSGLWYEYARAIRELGPKYVIVENVRALFTRGFDAVLGTLADLGYDAEWSMYGAADVGAPHKRQRVWILGHATGERRENGSAVGRGHSAVEGQTQQRLRTGGGCPPMGHADAGREPQPEGREPHQRGRDCDPSRELGHAQFTGLEGLAGHGDDGHQPGRINSIAARPAPTSSGGFWADAVPVRGYDGTVRLIPRQAAEEGPESSLWPLAHGVPDRVVRLRGVGNAIVPACALPIFQRIAELEAAHG